MWRKAVSTLLFVSFFWISYVAQTHIHGTPVSAGVAKTVHLFGKAENKAPLQNQTDDPADCPLCQAVALGGAAIVPLFVAVLAVPLDAQSVAFAATEQSPASHIGHAHQSRGPPSL